MISAELLRLLISVRRLYLTDDRKKSVPSGSMCRQLKEYIDLHFGEPITLQSLADIFFVSPYYVAHEFKEEIGVAPIQYLIRRRMQEACRLLTDTDMTLREISAAIGYDNMTHFSSLFKKNMHISPGQYRKNHIS